MLRCATSIELRDFLRSFDGSRPYGIPIAKNYMALPWAGAYTEAERTIQYFIARQIDNGNDVLVNYDLDTDLILYENGQYIYDMTSVFAGVLPEGVYFFEFNDGYDTYFTQIFAVNDISEIRKASSAGLCSSSRLIGSVNFDMPQQIVLKTFENDFYFIFDI